MYVCKQVFVSAEVERVAETVVKLLAVHVACFERII